MPFEFLPGLWRVKQPVDFDSLPIALLYPSLYFLLQPYYISDASVETLFRQSRKLDLSHI